MTSTRRLRVVVFALASTFALSQSVPAPQLHRTQSTSDAGWSDLMGAMEKMHAEMATANPTGDVDSDFVRLMLPHHQAALDMAKTQLLHGNDPQLLRLAQEIIADQQSEIEVMQVWLKQHQPGAPSADRTPALNGRKEQSK